MKQNMNLPAILNKAELLSEMESIMVLGGGYEGDNPPPQNSILSNCDSKNDGCTIVTFKYCNGVNCGSWCAQ